MEYIACGIVIVPPINSVSKSAVKSAVPPLARTMIADDDTMLKIPVM